MADSELTAPLLDEAERQARRYDFPIVDIDAHHLDLPWREMSAYIDEPWRTRIREMPGGRLLPLDLGDRWLDGRFRRPEFPKLEHSGETDVITPYRLAMEKIGITYSFAFSTELLVLGMHPQADLEVAIAFGYARWITERVCAQESSIKTMLYLPFNDPAASLRLIEEFGEKPGVMGFYVTSQRERPVHDPAYLPVYATLQERKLPLGFHSHTDWRAPQFRLFNNFLSAHALGFPLFNMLHLTDLILNGIPERFPKLKLVFIEAGVAWLPFVMQRMDTIYLMRRSEAPLLKRLPSEYVKDCYFSTQPLEMHDNMEDLQAVFDMIDAETQLCYSSDYPHWDFDLPGRIYDLPFLSDDAKRNILYRNAMRLFRLPEPEPARPSQPVRPGEGGAER